MMEIDTGDWKLKFRNERSNSSCEFKVPFIPEIENDQYNFCVGLTASTDTVNLLPDFEDSITIINQAN
jgi:hypothetical protein